MTNGDPEPSASSPIDPASTAEAHPAVSFPVVGIGASAGGLEACTQLLSELPDKPGVAIIVVQHLDPFHESRLTELLAKTTSMTVQEAVSGVTVQTDNVYVIPPNASLELNRGVLTVGPRAESRRPHFPVDRLFHSLAESQGPLAVGVVLSGTGTDGTAGLGEIKAVGGITFAQDEQSAKHSGMPRSAVDSGQVDFVLEPAEIARRLIQVAQHPLLGKVELDPPGKKGISDSQFQRLLATIRSQTGVDFTLYRDTTVKRRILRRITLHGHRSVAEYVAHLEKDRTEVEHLYHDILINVTSFFRDRQMFEALKVQAFPDALKQKSPTTPLRFWVPGCSTGQEAYSLAIAVVEFLDDKPFRPPVQIFATDLADQTLLEKARSGIYPESIEAEVTPERLQRFFKREAHGYRIDKSIRDLCVFARHNVAADPPFSHLDLISCRNLLIYLSPPLQKRVIPTFHYSLSQGGYLVLGTAETVGEDTDLFDLINRSFKIYRRRSGPTRHLLHAGTGDLRATGGIPARRAPAPGSASADYQREADRILLGRYAPPGVLVNEHLDVVQYRGRTSRYLEAPPGDPTTALLKIAREGLFLELRNAVAEAQKTGSAVERRGIPLRIDDRAHEIDLEVIPVHPPGSGERCFLVLFHEQPDRPGTAPAPPEQSPRSKVEEEQEIAALRLELGATKDYLQALIEQQDAANEELRSANEEVLSSNEELQSTNEELETAKEELQSANEELTTVNEQLHYRNLELTQLNNDLINLFSSTNIPVVMVGGDLRIRRFTAPARKLMDLLPTDVGRPIGDLKSLMQIPDLEDLIAKVIETVQPVEREVVDRNGHQYAVRVHPYRTTDNKIDGAVIVLVDIDELKRIQNDLRVQTAQLRAHASLIEVSREAIVVRGADQRITTWSKGAEATYGWSAAEAIGHIATRLLHTTAPGAEDEVELGLQQHGYWEGELRQTRKDGTAMVVDSRQVLVRDDAGGRVSILQIDRDVTERVQFEDELRLADRRKDAFLATLAHELRNPLGPIRNAVEIIRLSDKGDGEDARVRNMLERQVRHMTRIVDDLIDVSRIAEGKVVLRRERVSLASVFEAAVDASRFAITPSEVELVIALTPVPIYLDADPTRLGQVMANLLINAGKFSKPGGKIYLSATFDRKDPGFVTIRVRDEGEGISSEVLPHIFELFVQGQDAIARGAGGLGLGLTLARRLVELHGGTIEGRSEGPGTGSEFIVRLPIAETAMLGVAAVDKSLDTAPASGPKRILVVDDSRDQADTLGMLLGLDGHEVRLAGDAEGALELLNDFTPDVALIDIGLPGMNGYDLARRIRTLPGFDRMILVAQTGWGQDKDRQASKIAGFDYHLIKPIDPDALRRIVGSAGGGGGGDDGD